MFLGLWKFVLGGFRPFLPRRSLAPPTWSARPAGGFDPRVFFVTSLLIVLGFVLFGMNLFLAVDGSRTNSDY